MILVNKFKSLVFSAVTPEDTATTAVVPALKGLLGGFCPHQN
jgi:hypothetical protein